MSSVLVWYAGCTPSGMTEGQQQSLPFEGEAVGLTPGTLWDVVKTAAADWWNDNAMRWAASVAFYTLFSLAPILLTAVAVAGFFFGHDRATREMVKQMRMLLGEPGGTLIESTLANAYQRGSNGLMTAIGIGMILFAATGVFAELQAGLNSVWEVKPKPTRPWLAMLKDRLLSFGMVVGVGFLLLLSLAVSTTLTLMAERFGVLSDKTAAAWKVIYFTVSLVVVILLFAMIFKFLPDARIRWRDVWVGAITTGVLFGLGKFAIGAYLGQSTWTSAYGAAGSLVVFLVWIYYSVQILFFGAELTQAYARKFGPGLVPNTEIAERDHRTPEERVNKKDESKAKE